MNELAQTMRAGDWIKTADAMPGQDDVIEALLPQGETMIITGGPYMGKSLEAQHLACQFPMGGKYHGLKVRQCDSLYITWEGSPGGIAKRFRKLLCDVPVVRHPLLHRANESMPLNTDTGREAFETRLKEARELCPVKVVMCDSFTYTIKGDTKKDEVMNPWWESVQELSSRHGLTFIFVWEMVKPLIFQGAEIDPYGLSRLKTSYSSAYKVNTVVAIGETKAPVWDKEEGKTVRKPISRQIVVMKAKDMGMLKPLKVELDQSTLVFNGQHWRYNQDTDEYDAVGSEQ